LSVEVRLLELRKDNSLAPALEADHLVLMFPVHVFDAPQPVYEFIEQLPLVKGRRAAVVSISGGGEVFPNRACRRVVCLKLEQKGYCVDFESMLVMPNNTIIPTGENTSLGLLRILREQSDEAVEQLAVCDEIASDLADGVTRRVFAPRGDRIFAGFSRHEKDTPGLKKFGERIKAGDTCNYCGWCVQACPQNNISMASDTSLPHFGSSCALCLRCIYGCPEHALSPGIASFLVIRNGFSLSKMEQQDSIDQTELDRELKGALWVAVRKYIEKYLRREKDGSKRTHGDGSSGL